MTERVYRGVRRPDGACRVTVEWAGVRPTLLPLRLDLRNHSPTGFEWGYQGSGPAQLALALCCHVLTRTRTAERVYQAFKRRVVAGLPKEEWALTDNDIRTAIEAIQQEPGYHDHTDEGGEEEEKADAELPVAVPVELENTVYEPPVEERAGGSARDRKRRNKGGRGSDAGDGSGVELLPDVP